MRILLVEDNRDILANLADYLGMKGYTVDCAQDGLSGLHLAATEHYDLIVLHPVQAPARRRPPRYTGDHAHRPRPAG